MSYATSNHDLIICVGWRWWNLVTVLWALRYINILSSTLKDKKKYRKLEWWNHLTNSKAHKTPNLGFVSIQSEGRSSIFVYEFEFFPSYSSSGDFFDHWNVEVAERKVILVLIICVHGQSRFFQFFFVCEETAVSASTVEALTATRSIAALTK